MPAADEPGPESVPAGEPRAGYQASLGTVLREWGRIGCVGFGGPPAHIALLRKLCVDRERWLDATEFEDAISACNLLPGPASTQLAIFCAWRVRGRLGALRVRSASGCAAENERLHSFGILQRKLLCNHAAHRDPKDMGAGNASSVEHCGGVGSHEGD